MIPLQGILYGVPFFELALLYRKGKREQLAKLGQRIVGQGTSSLVISSECWLGTPRL